MENNHAVPGSDAAGLSHMSQSFAHYIEAHILKPYSQQTVSRQIYIMRTLMVLLGLIWGVPWIAAASAASQLFSSFALQHIFSFIFGIGIVITVGVDGAWIMFDLGRRLFIQQAQKNTQTTAKLFARRILVTLCAMAACIPAVYAAFRYNTGVHKLLALIVLCVNLGYGLYAYNRLLDVLFPSPTAFSMLPETLSLKKHLLNSIQAILNGKENILVPASITSGKDYVDYLLQKTTTQKTGKSLSGRKILKYGLAGMIALSAGTVNFCLTQHFLRSFLSHDSLLIYTLPFLVAIPETVMDFISTCYLIEKLFSVMIERYPYDSLLSRIHPRAARLLPLCAFCMALTAPSAAGYITYTILKSSAMPVSIILLATFFISATRFLFSNFTLNNMGREMLLVFAKRKASHAPVIHTHRALTRFSELLAK